MTVHLAQGPSHQFLNVLVATADSDDVEIGDTVEMENYETGEGIEGAKVVEAADDGWVLEWTENGEEKRTTTGEDEYVTTTHSPALARAYEDALSGQPDGVAWADGAVPDELVARLSASFDSIIESGAPSFHPRSKDVVLDLVHPSLFPYVKGRSTTSGEEPEVVSAEYDRWGRPYEGSTYQWLPAEFDVDDSGKTAIKSYVNNLDRGETLGELEELFSVALPLFESVYGYIQTQSYISEGWEKENDECEADLPEPAEKLPPKPAPEPVSLKGRRLQVVCKLVEYQLDETKTFEGVWHAEGMSHEHVVATAVYVLDRDEQFTGGALQFKRPYTLDEAGQVFWNVPQIRKAHTDEIVGEGLIPLGTLDTPKGRLFVFPNSHVHKISDMSSSGGEARRRVIAFWLVDPEVRIVSTAHVEPQQGLFSAAEAKEIQLALMEERRVHKQSMNVRAVELCEH